MSNYQLMLTIGSQAYDFGREPRDYDYITTPENLKLYKEAFADKIVLAKPSKFGETIFMMGSKPIEVDTSETGQELLKIVEANNLAYYSCDDKYIAYPEVLLALKLSHRFLKNSIHFLKTMSDVWTFRNAGIVVPDVLTEWVKRREKATYDYKHPNLNQGSKDFFTTNFPYKFLHDDIHKSVKIYDEPAFLKMQEPETEVFCSKEKFYTLPEEIRLASVAEEVMTLALERSQIVNDFNIDRKKSYVMALERVCSGISSGWWRTYAWDNYYKVLDMYDDTYVDKFKDALARGEIRPYEVAKPIMEIENKIIEESKK